MRIAEVRRYTPQGLSYPLQEMLAELGVDLVPDVADDRARAAVYEASYGFERCTRGFVTMRFLWPNGVAAATKKQRTSSNTGPVACMSLASISRDASEVVGTGSADPAASTDPAVAITVSSQTCVRKFVSSCSDVHVRISIAAQKKTRLLVVPPAP